MLIPRYKNVFLKELERDKKRGKNISKLKEIIDLLVLQMPIPIKNLNHKLKGEYEGFWECHIEPNWLLIYKKTKTEIIFSRLGSHSDLF